MTDITTLPTAQEGDMPTPAQPDATELAELKAEAEQDAPAPEPEAVEEKPKRRSRKAKEKFNEMLGATLEQLKGLNCETPEDEIGYRPANFKDPQGKQLAYVDARYVMDVLDDKVGPHNWSNRYLRNEDGSVECTITIRMADGDYIAKTDVGVPSTIEPVKGAYSDAFKRAAVHFGIARDLYDERIADNPTAAPVAAVAPAAAAAAANPAAMVPAAAPAQQTIAEATAAGAEAPAAEATVANWVCPIHGTGRIQPAGVSKRTGKAYAAFWVCTERGCDQTGGNA